MAKTAGDAIDAAKRKINEPSTDYISAADWLDYANNAQRAVALDTAASRTRWEVTVSANADGTIAYSKYGLPSNWVGISSCTFDGKETMRQETGAMIQGSPPITSSTATSTGTGCNSTPFPAQTSRGRR